MKPHEILLKKLDEILNYAKRNGILEISICKRDESRSLQSIAVLLVTTSKPHPTVTELENFANFLQFTFKTDANFYLASKAWVYEQSVQDPNPFNKKMFQMMLSSLIPLDSIENKDIFEQFDEWESNNSKVVSKQEVETSDEPSLKKHAIEAEKATCFTATTSAIDPKPAPPTPIIFPPKVLLP